MSIHRRAPRPRAAALLATALVAASLAACGSDDDDGGGADGDADSIKVWIEEDLPDRVAATQAIVDAFTEATGIKVELVAVAEDQFNQILTSNAAAGDLPDVIGGLPLGQVRTLSANELVDTDAVGDVLDGLDRGTFSESALELTADGDDQLAIPSESWVQLLVYRKDLFDAAGPGRARRRTTTCWPPPRRSTAPTSPASSAPTSPVTPSPSRPSRRSASATTASWSTTRARSPSTATSASRRSTSTAQLQQDYSVTGAQDVDTTRASYFAGQAAMIIWSSFILDEMAGLRNDALPTCPECKDDPALPGQEQRRGHLDPGPVRLRAGHVRRDHLVDDHRRVGHRPGQAVRRVHDERRLRAVDRDRARGQDPGPRRRQPGRDRTTPTPGPAMDVGVDTKAPLSEFYGQDVIDALTTGTDTLARWAIPQGQGDLLGAIQGEQPVANAVNEVANGTDAEEAAEQAADAIRAVAGLAVTVSGPTAPRRGDGRGHRTRSTSAPLPAGAVRPGPGGPADRLPADLADRRHRLRDGGAADPVDDLAGLPARPAAQPAHDRLLRRLQPRQLRRRAHLPGLRRRAGHHARLLGRRHGVRHRPRAGRGAGAAQAVPRPGAGARLHAAAVRRSGGRRDVRVDDDAQPAVRRRQPLRHHAAGLGRADRLPELGGADLAVRDRPARQHGRCSPSCSSRAGAPSPSPSSSSPRACRRSPSRLEEAAMVDGATPTQRFRHIVLPQLLPTIAVLTVLRFIWTFNNFDDIYLLTGGGVGHPGRRGPGLRLPDQPRRHRRRGGPGAGPRRDPRRAGDASTSSSSADRRRWHEHPRAATPSSARIFGVAARRSSSSCLLLITLFPFYYMVLLSFRPLDAVLQDPGALWPSRARSTSAPTATCCASTEDGGQGFLTFIKNSFLVAIGTVVLTLLVAIPGAYAVSRLEFFGRRQISAVFLGVYFFPSILLAIPLFVFFTRIQQRGTLTGLLIVYVAQVAAVSIYMLRNYFDTIPASLEEAAAIDGCTRLQAMRHISLPLAMPAIASNALFVFMIAWNEFLFALLFLVESRDELDRLARACPSSPGASRCRPPC